MQKSCHGPYLIRTLLISVDWRPGLPVHQVEWDRLLLRLRTSPFTERTPGVSHRLSSDRDHGPNGKRITSKVSTFHRPAERDKRTVRLMGIRNSRHPLWFRESHSKVRLVGPVDIHSVSFRMRKICSSHFKYKSQTIIVIFNTSYSIQPRVKLFTHPFYKNRETDTKG